MMGNISRLAHHLDIPYIIINRLELGVLVGVPNGLELGFLMEISNGLELEF